MAERYQPLHEPILNNREAINPQRTERVVTLSFCVRIGARGDSARLAVSLRSVPKTKK
jgi:hypothetical protein